MGNFFEKLNGPRVTSALNVLGEAPYFYRDDDPDLFAFLRRNRAEFERFYRELYGWELVVDGRTAFVCQVVARSCFSRHDCQTV